MEESKENNAQDTPGTLPGTIRLDGINYPWMVTRETLDAVKSYDVWEDDVWILSYLKSGTHWTMEFVNLILVDGFENKVNRAQHSSPAEFDYTPIGMTSSTRRPPRSQIQCEAMKKWKPPRAIMTHLTEDRLPTQLYQGKGKVVFIIRNPKDAAVSQWHFVIPWKFDSKDKDWDYFLQKYMAGEGIYGSWFDLNLGFWKKHRYDKNFLFLKYEDMKQDTRGAVIQIADFLGKPLSEEAIERVVEAVDINSMKKRFDAASSPASHYVPPSSSETAAESAPSDGRTGPSTYNFPIGAPSLVRKGIVGDWKSKFTVAQNEAYDALFQKKMAGSGLKVQFE